MKIKTEPNFFDMKNSIKEAGGLFYQYRPCRRDVSTIYDIENIKHGVVYAQTPLNMNDPFDSMAGFSTEKFYNNCISLLLDTINIEDANLKTIIAELLKSKAIGKFTELFYNLNELKKYIFSKRLIMHQTKTPIQVFVTTNSKLLYSNCPKKIKDYFSKDVFLAFSLVVGNLENTEINESTLNDVFNFEGVLEHLYAQILDIKDNTYLPTMRTFLSQLTVSCFSTSGWNNQLMWSHYANSYSGICIEYDFNAINEFIGFIYPVEYTSVRPTLTLQDLGVKVILEDGKNKVIQGETDMVSIFSYLLAKNECWEYEKEWRIINIGEAYKPLFVNLPCIKSITLGLKMDPLCKHLIWDICRDKNIDCYQIIVSTEDYTLERKLLSHSDFTYDLDEEINYVNLLSNQIADTSKKIEMLSAQFKPENEDPDFSYMYPILKETIDMLTNSYYFKLALNRIGDNANEDLSQVTMPGEIKESVSQVNIFVDQVKETVASLNTVIITLKIAGKINKEDYPKIKSSLENLEELATKLENIPWNSIYLS